MKLWDDMWIVPLGGSTFVCWTKNGDIKNHELSLEEESEYYNSGDKERVLNEIIRNVC